MSLLCAAAKGRAFESHPRSAELEEQRQKLVADVNANQRTLKRLEDDLLYRLANSEGNLLDDTSLIEVLQQQGRSALEEALKELGIKSMGHRLKIINAMIVQ